MSEDIDIKVAMMQSDINSLKKSIDDIRTDISDIHEKISVVGERMVRIETLLDQQQQNKEEPESSDSSSITFSVKQIVLLMVCVVLAVGAVLGLDVAGILG